MFSSPGSPPALAKERNMENPKATAGIKKIALELLPPRVMADVVVAFEEGVRKYGRYNYRQVDILASTYMSSTKRHLDAWYEGEDFDQDSQLNHITKAIAGLMVLRDSMLGFNFVDDRPNSTDTYCRGVAIRTSYEDKLQALQSDVTAK